MSRIPLKYHTNVLFYTKNTHPTLICRGTDAQTDGCTDGRTDGRTDRRTENIHSIFRDKLLLLGEHVLWWYCTYVKKYLFGKLYVFYDTPSLQTLQLRVCKFETLSSRTLQLQVCKFKSTPGRKSIKLETAVFKIWKVKYCNCPAGAKNCFSLIEHILHANTVPRQRTSHKFIYNIIMILYPLGMATN
jgi:hypothetical protein